MHNALAYLSFGTVENLFDYLKARHPDSRWPTVHIAARQARESDLIIPAWRSSVIVTARDANDILFARVFCGEFAPEHDPRRASLIHAFAEQVVQDLTAIAHDSYHFSVATGTYLLPDDTRSHHADYAGYAARRQRLQQDLDHAQS